MILILDCRLSRLHRFCYHILPVDVGGDKLLIVFEMKILNSSDDEEEDCDEDLLENREK